MSENDNATFRRAAWEQIQQASSELDRSHLKGTLEAVIFAAPKPQKLRDLVRITKASKPEITALLADLVADYEGRGITLAETSEGWAFLSNPRFGGEVRLVTGKKPVRMSRAQLETLAIVAYRQPVTRPEIDEVRGVDSGPVLRTLLDRELIKVLGKKEEPGRPLLYGTTEAFLALTQLKSLADLPTLREFTELSEESRDTYQRKLGENAPSGEIVFDDEPDAPIDPTQPQEDEEVEPPTPEVDPERADAVEDASAAEDASEDLDDDFADLDSDDEDDEDD
ncbi:MAG: SMC-Scp complex subunit ScpB, partial [Myxococcales bacterium]|nr:SMC-Scp complex subunit ScpB [Myxococcales bacterium]